MADKGASPSSSSIIYSCYHPNHSPCAWDSTLSTVSSTSLPVQTVLPVTTTTTTITRPASTSISAPLYGSALTTTATAASRTSLTIITTGLPGPIEVEWPSAGCDGFRVNSTCVPWPYWLDMYNEAFPLPITTPGAPQPQSTSGFKTSDFEIHGPSEWCNGFTINSFCFRIVDVLAMMGDRLTSLSSALATTTATEAASSPVAAHSDPKLAFIAIPLVVIIIAVFGGIWFWRRRLKKQASAAPAPPLPPSPDPIAQMARLYGSPSPIAERDRRTLLDEARQSGGSRYLRNGVKIFDARHARKARERETARNSAEQGPSTATSPRKEWWDKDLMF